MSVPGPLSARLGRAGALAVIAAFTAIGLAACGGSAHTPHVADLGTTTTLAKSTRTNGGGAARSQAAASPAVDPTRLVDEWAACMRAHGDPGQADPTIDADKVIHVTWDPATPGGIYGTQKGGQGNLGPGQYCRSYLSAAQQALRGPQQAQPGETELLKYSECMRANGVPDFPDPSGGNLSVSANAAGDLNPDDPTYHNAQKICDRKTGVQFGSTATQPGMIEINGAAPPGAADG